jgi:hypothetical protein
MLTLLVEQFTEISNDEIGSSFAKRIGITGAVHTDYQTETARPPRLHPRHGVLNHDRPVRFDAQSPGTFEKGVRGWFAGEGEFSRHDAIDTIVEQIVDAGRPQDPFAVLAGRDDRGGEPLAADVPYPGNRVLVEVYTLRIQ